MKSNGLLRAAVMTALVFGGIAAGTFLFSAAYDAGVLSAASSAAGRRISGSAASAASSAPARPASVSAAASAASKLPVSSGTKTELREHSLVLVNSENPIPSWYKPDLTDSFGVQMDRSVMEPFTEMRTSASKDGVSLWISSAYRDSELQSSLFQREVEEHSKTSPTYSEAVAAAARSVAKPGCSEHETGLALDLNGVKDDFDTTPAFRWLDKHAQDYGFILRYPKNKESVTNIRFEPWHFRYVGVESAKAIKRSGLCLEEYLSQIADTPR